jgi:hypothetical protein
MATTINASNGSTSGLIQTGDASGVLQLQVNNGTPALTLNTTQALGVGSSPSYGTSGQFLTSQGSAASPTWTSAPASAMTLISTQTMSSGSIPSWTGLSGYNHYLILCDGLVQANAGSQVCYVQFGEGSTPTWLTTGYFSTQLIINSSPTGSKTNNTSGITVDGSTGFFNNTTLRNGFIYINNFGNSPYYASANCSFNYTDYTGNNNNSGICNGTFTGDTTAKTAIRLTITSGFNSGTASLYGISS